MSIEWRDQALCLRFADLPWITDPQHRSISAVRAMEGVCGACPVILDCDDFARSHRITSGFYAGKDRTPQRSRTKVHRQDGAA